MTGHALLSPSSAHRWIPCPGSIALSAGHSDGGNIHAATGTVAHLISEKALTDGGDTSAYIGESHTIVNEEDASESWTIEVDEEMAGYTQVYVDYVRRRAAELGCDIGIEYRVELSDVLAVPDQGGTADALLVDDMLSATLEVADLKYGFGSVEAEGNPQLMLYALGALEAAEAEGAVFENVIGTIVQPRLDQIKSFEMTPADLRAFGKEAQQAALKAMRAIEHPDPTSGDFQKAYLNPGEKQCQWCPRKATCPALASFVNTQVFDQFDDVSEPTVKPVPEGATALKLYHDRVALIQDWCKAVTSAFYASVERGEMPGYKLVPGKKGNRAWKDEESVEELFASFRLKKEEKYNMKLISPTQAEKVLTPARWEKAQALITQAQGKPKAVPEDHPGEAIPTGPLFDNVIDESLI